MTVYSEETVLIPVGLGLDSYHHPANLEDGFCSVLENMTADGQRLETRKGLQPPGSFDTRQNFNNIGFNNYYTRIPNSSTEDWPVGIYGTNATTIMIRQFDRDNPAGTDTANGIQEFSTISNFRGACSYLDRIYVNSNSGVDHLSSFNWSAGTVTKTNIASAPASTRGLFVFKDRMWCWDDTKIYFTDVPASPGAYPETWGSNFIVIGAGTGLGKIWSIIPVGTSLFVFTGSGLFTVAVIGSPANWVVRTIDKTVQVNHQSCAYEHQGFIYFIDIEGVKVTDGSEVKTISESIKDLFQIASDTLYYLYKLVPFEDGIIICRQTVAVEGSYPSAANRFISDAKIYYTRLDFIAWSEWTFDTTTQPGDILAGFAKMETKDLWQASSYLVLAHGTSTVAVPNDLTSQLLRYTGYQDKLHPQSAAEQTAAVSSTFTSKVIRGELFKNKRAKYAYLNFTADAASLPDTFNVSYSWDTEALSSTSSGTITDSITNIKDSLVKIKADFQWRHCLLTVTSTLDAGISKYTFLGAGLINMTHRKEVRRES